MVQFLSIIFFFWMYSIFVGFFKSSRFFYVTLYKERAAFYVQAVVFYERKFSIIFAACHARGTFDSVHSRRYIQFHDHFIGMWDMLRR